MELSGLYRSKIEELSDSSRTLSRRANLVAAGRFILFLLAVASLIAAIRTKSPWLIGLTVAATAGFLALLKIALKTRHRIGFINELITINRQELQALEGDLSPFDPGNEYLNPHHDFSYDLDIFGTHSLYRLLCRTATPRGSDLLARRLMEPETDSGTIRLRQQAVAELAPHVDWRQHYQATARQSGTGGSRENGFQAWLNDPDHFSGNPLFRIIVVLNAAISLLITVLLILQTLIPNSFPATLPAIAFLWFLVPVTLVVSLTRRINREQLKLENLLGLLRKYSELLHLLETHPFESAYLKKIRASLVEGPVASSRCVGKLTGILWGLEARGNLIVSFFLNAFLLWDILQMMRLERWRHDHGSRMDQWLEAIAEAEVLLSLANLMHNRPDMPLPEILDGTFRMTITGGGHPLIPPARRVDNSLDFPESARMYLITGANMAGKSTLLRMVGTNMVLAMAGGPVCAANMSMVPTTILTSVRTNDSLGDDESYFHAELKRLGRIIRLAESGQQPFVIVDEMLKGTNSRDKHTGSAALIRKLVGLRISGLAATHDIDLGELATDYPDSLVNRCFEVGIEGDQLLFDYVLREGVSKNLNATFLMRKMGIIPETF